ncbi:MAG: phosphopyruvate hydratase [Candidatus Geothermarchaeota archaeon]
MTEIKSLKGFITYTSNGIPTIEVIATSKSGVTSRYAPPTGLSVSTKEVNPYPKGGLNALLDTFNSISRKLIGFSYESQEEIDSYLKELDGTNNYENIGGAISLALSIVCAELASKELNVPLFYWISKGFANNLPIPLGNLIGGGKHARNKSIDIQEILAMPKNPKSYKEAYYSLNVLHNITARLLSKKDVYFSGGKNDEGAWTTTLTDESALAVVNEAIDLAEKETGIKYAIGIDFAASSLWDADINRYYYPRKRTYLSKEEQLNYVLSLIDEYRDKLQYIEDPFYENDFSGFEQLTREVGDKIFITGDDLYATNKLLIALGIERKATNAVVIKPNQRGDLTETIRSSNEAKRGKMLTVVSHRSGETPYPHLAHIAIGLGSDLFKCGIVGGERIIKHSEMMYLEEEFGLKLVSITR